MSKREEILGKIREQGYAYVWTGLVYTYESMLSAEYCSVRVIDNVPHLSKLFTHKNERGGTYVDYEAEEVILSPFPFKVQVIKQIWEEKKYVDIKEEEAKRVEGALLNHYIELFSKKI
ncbi:MAG: hypothetical protein QW334_03280 [Thermofilum sp.]